MANPMAASVVAGLVVMLLVPFLALVSIANTKAGYSQEIARIVFDGGEIPDSASGELAGYMEDMTISRICLYTETHHFRRFLFCKGEDSMTDREIMLHRFSNRNVKKSTSVLAKQLGIPRTEYEAACIRAMAAEAKEKKIGQYNVREETFERAEVDGVEVLFTNARLDRDTVPEGLFCYDVREAEGCSGIAATLEPFVAVNHWGTVLSKQPFPMDDGFYEIEDEGFNYLGEKMTMEEYLQENPQEKQKDGQKQNGSMDFSL